MPGFPLFLAEASSPQSSMYSGVIMLVLAVFFFYFIILRPEQKRRKAQETKRAALRVGDKVTAVGIVGVVDKIKETTLIIKTADSAKIEILKAAISDVQSDCKIEGMCSK